MGPATCDVCGAHYMECNCVACAFCGAQVPDAKRAGVEEFGLVELNIGGKQ